MLQGQVQRLIQEEIASTLKEQKDFSHRDWQKPEQSMWGWIPRVLDQGRQSITLDQALCTHERVLIGDSGFNCVALAA